LAIPLILGVGFTRIVKLWGLLEQPLRVAITCTLLSMGKLELLVEVKALILSEPNKESNPVLILLFVQFMVLPVKLEPVKMMLEITVPAQTVCESIGDNAGAGLTTI
jgi:hypothetical protein